MADPTSCPKCGERFRRAHDAGVHICTPNYTPWKPHDEVFFDGVKGVVQRVDRGQVAVYVPAAFRTWWLDAYDSRLEKAS